MTETRNFQEWMKILPEIRSNTIPPMTHELSKAWDQPSTDRIKIDDKYAAMDEKTFKELKEYSCSQPSGVYEGKMWKANYSRHKPLPHQDPQPDIWYLCWFGFSEDPNCCSNNRREIKIVN